MFKKGLHSCNGVRMNDFKNERKLFFELIVGNSFEKIEDIASRKDINYYVLLGYLAINRVAGLAYSNIRKYEYNIRSDQFLFALENIFNAQRERNQIMQKEIQKINFFLSERQIPYAFLKGSILTNILYQKGERVSNDIDILINSQSISEIEESLKKLEYYQGDYDIKTGKIIKPTRREIVLRRMNWGETFPLVKIFDSKNAIKFLEVDLNFSLDWLPVDRNNAVENMLLKTIEYGDSKLRSLCLEDFLIHLLMHIYKELILYFSVSVARDMEFYKFVDIVRFVNTYDAQIDWKYFSERVKAFELSEGIYTALYYVKLLFAEYLPLHTIELILNDMIKDGIQLKDDILDYEKKVKYKYAGTISERLFDTSRLTHLIVKGKL